MKGIFATLLILSATGILHSHPAPVSTLQYELGVSYKYTYQFNILLNEDSNITSRSASVGRDVGYKVSSDIILTNVWQNVEDVKEKLLKLELMKPTLHVSSTLHSVEGITKHWSKLDNLSYPPIYIHWNNGLVKKVYLLPDIESMTNIKKGLASLFQLHVTQGETKELDVSGLCKVLYKADGKTVKKRRSHCKSARIKEQDYESNRLRSSTVAASSELIYDLLPEGVIKTAIVNEEVMMNLNIWKQAAVFVKSKLKLSLMEQYPNQPIISVKDIQTAVSSISKEIGTKLEEGNLEAVTNTDTCQGDCKTLGALVEEYYEHLLPENLARIKSATGFLKLLEGFRRASKKDLLMMFKDADERFLPQLLDILAATQTKESLDVAFELIDFESDDITIPERFLLCLAASPYPSETVIHKTLKLMKKKFRSEKLQATVLITLSSLIRTYSKNNPKHTNSKVVENVIDVILHGYKCAEPSCLLIQLQAMRNAAHPKFIPILLKYIPVGETQGHIALEALKSIGEEHFTKEVNDVLHKVYNQFWPHQDSAARVLAAELLIKSSPNVETIGNLILSLADREHPEVNALVLAKLRAAVVKNSSVRSCVKEVLRNITFGNYNNLAQNGTSTTYTKLLQATHDANVTYGINLEMRSTGMLKRTSVDLEVSSDEEDLPLLSLGLFVNGFGLTDEEQKAKEVPEEHSAGMELSVLGVHLRPYTFFTGTTDLMGLVWSGVGTEPTPALQANLLLMDQMKSVMLHSGVAVDFVLKGAMSADVSGAIEISMWNKNAHAVVRNSAALLVQGFCRVDTSFVESHVDFALGGNTALVMGVNLDYSHKPMKMCIQIEQPNYVFRHNVRKTETIPGSKHLIRTLKRRSLDFPGRSYALHQNNYNSCRELLYPKPQSYW